MTAPIRREVIVATTPDRAFAQFTEQIGSWWPLQTLSVHRGSVAFEGDRLVERTADAEAVWAEVTEWEPPSRLALDWHPGGERERATRVRVEFSAHDDGTLVTLTHDGWERLADPDVAAEEYGHGWIGVLDLFAASTESEQDDA